MKTKNLYILAKGFFSLLFIIVVGVIPSFMFFHHPAIAISILLGLVIIGLIIYMVNIPGYKMQKFYDHEIKTFKRFNGLKYKYYRAKYQYSCGPAVIQTYLDAYGIEMSQDEILELTGDKRLGTSPWEMVEAMNTIFHTNNLPLRARINNYTTYAQLFDAVHDGKGVIVMFINQFHEPGYPRTASYPHFALVNYIKMNHKEHKNKVVLLNPSFSSESNPNFKPGKYEGEIQMSIEEFQERFYISQKHLNRLRFKPTRTKNGLLNTWNRILNFLFIFAFYVGYCTRILKPGMAIFIESIEKKGLLSGNICPIFLYKKTSRDSRDVIGLFAYADSYQKFFQFLESF